MSRFYTVYVITKMMIENIITEVGFILLGGLVALVPVYILGTVLRGDENG